MVSSVLVIAAGVALGVVIGGGLLLLIRAYADHIALAILWTAVIGYVGLLRG